MEELENQQRVVGSPSSRNSNIIKEGFNDDDKHNRRINAGTLPIIILVVLGLLIIGLMIGIVILGFGDTSEDVADTQEEYDVSCVELEDSVEIGQCIQNEYRKDGDIDGLVSSYNRVIALSLEEKDLDTAVELINDRSMFLLSVNECEVALDLLSKMCLSSFDNEALYLIYSNAISISNSCDNEDFVRKYSTLRRQLEFGENSHD